jgi:hypothetical protein
VRAHGPHSLVWLVREILLLSGLFFGALGAEEGDS